MSFKQLNCSREYFSVFMGFTLSSCQDYKNNSYGRVGNRTESSRVGTTQVSEVRRNRPKSDGTVRNQTEAFGIRRKCPKSDGGFVRNQRFVSPFSLLANRKKTQEIEQYYRYQLNTCNNGERHNKQVSQIY